MPLNYKRRLILEAVEVTPGTAVAPAATDAVLCRARLDFNPISGSWTDRDLTTGHEGAQPDIHTNTHGMVEREIEASASGTAGTPPPYAAALLSAGLAEVTVADTSVTYSPVSSGYQATTIKTHIGGADGHAQTIAGCRSALSFTANRAEVPFFALRTLGQYAAPADAAPPGVDYSGFKPPVTIEPRHVAEFTLGGQKLCMRSFTLQDGRNPVVDKFANCPGTDITSRAFTGSMVVEFPKLATKDTLANSLNGVLEAFAFEIGKVGGATLRIEAPRMQLKFTGYQDVEGTVAGAYDFKLIPTDAGDDEIAFIFT